MDLPAAALAPLIRQFLEGRNLAWLGVDQEGNLEEFGGALARYDLHDLRAGTPVVDQVDCVHGIALSPPEALELSAIEVSTGVYADVFILPLEVGALIVLLDATAQVVRDRALLHKGNVLDLMRERLDSTSAGLPHRGDVLEALGLVMMELGPDGVLRSAGPPAGWLAHILGLREAAAVSLDEVDSTTFLGNFLEDARRFWAARQAGSLRSGLWSEVGAGEEELFLEAICVVDQQGRCWLVIELLSDLYEERRLILQRGRETRLDYELLRDEMQKKDVLLHCIVHDLRAPLSSIVGVLSLLHGRRPSEERVEQLIELALRQARRQDTQIRRVLDVFAAEVAALEEWEQDPGRAPDLRLIAAEAVERAQPAFQQREVALSFVDQSEGPCIVVGKLDRIERVLDNLLENARRFSPAGSETNVALTTTATNVRVTVEDHGPGVPDELRDELFDRFAQGEAGGGLVGLGLYFCRITLERWGGSIHHDPTPGGGASFTIDLPKLPST